MDDKKLKISTSGRDDAGADAHHHPYEPTPYEVLERLADSGYLTKDNIVVDYGCGKGRVDFYLSARLGCRTIGIEYDERIFREALKNNESFAGRTKPEFVCANAEGYCVEAGDAFYFFNPFTVEILQGVLSRILDSYYVNPREMRLFFYYPDSEYVACLMTRQELLFVDEIDCGDLFEGKCTRECILIFDVVG